MTEIVTVTEESTTEPVRRLVTVQRITDLLPIDGKDRIELARVLGYRVIVQKGLHKIGSLVAFHEEGSFVPVDAPHYADLIKIARFDNVGKRRARIKTIKMGGVYSQGYIVPLADLSFTTGEAPAVFEEGADLTALLDVVKYDDAIAPLPGTPGARPKGPPPPGMQPWPTAKLAGIVKTDEERLQSAPFLLDEMRGRMLVITGKMDGSSVTVAKNHDGEVIVCSRNNRWTEHEGVVPFYLQAMRELGVIDRLPAGYAVQGELCGPGVQGNKAGFPSLRFFVFNVFHRFDDGDDFEEQDQRTARGFCQEHGLTPVPAIMSNLLHDGRYDVDWFVNFAAGEKYSNGYPAEGLVVRPMTPATSDKIGRRLSFKVISPVWEERQGKAADKIPPAPEPAPAAPSEKAA